MNKNQSLEMWKYWEKQPEIFKIKIYNIIMEEVGFFDEEDLCLKATDRIIKLLKTGW